MPLTPIRVLLADDDELSLELVAMMLEAENYAVIRSSSGTEAIEQLQAIGPQAFPEVLLLDLQMPGLSGSELAEKCRRLLAGNAPGPATGSATGSADTGSGNTGTGDAGTGETGTGDTGSAVTRSRVTTIVAMSATRPPDSGLSGYDAFVNKPFSVAAFQQALKQAREQVVVEPAASNSDAGPYGRDLDHTIYDKLAGMMPAARLNEIYATCLADTIRRIPIMQKAGAAGDLVDVRRIAHAIKGGSSMIGARSIAALAAELELGQYSIQDVPRLLLELSSACERLGSILLLP